MLIGLTGGIASGKSMVSGRLRELGAFVLDADEEYARLVQPGGALLAAIAGEFGQGVLSPAGGLNRPALSKIVFGNAERLGRLNGLTHPAVLQGMFARAHECLAQEPAGVAVLDVPLLIECGAHKQVDQVWLVAAPEELRVQRLMARSGCTLEQARARVAAQMPQREKLVHADVVIDNSGSIEALMHCVDELWAEVSHG